MRFKDYLLYEEMLAIILEDDGPPVVPMGEQPTPPSGMGGGWVKGGPFRPYSGGGHWFGELYNSVKQAAVASRMKGRLSQLGIKGVGAARVDTAFKTAISNVRDLLSNPQKTAYHFPTWTTKTAKKINIPVWKEALAYEFGRALMDTPLEDTDEAE